MIEKLLAELQELANADDIAALIDYCALRNLTLVTLNKGGVPEIASGSGVIVDWATEGIPEIHVAVRSGS